MRDGFWKGTFEGCFDHLSHEWMVEHIPTDHGKLRCVA